MHTHWMVSSLRLTRQSFWPVCRRFWPICLTLGLISLAFDQYCSYVQKLMEPMDSPPVVLLGLLVLISLTWQVLSGAALIIVGSIGAEDHLSGRHSAVLSLTRQTLKPMSIETLRALGNSLLWAYLGIVPGIVKYIRYSFVPYIVLFEPQYQMGNIDALRRSEQLVRGHTLAVGFLIAAYFCLILAFYGLTQTIQTAPLDNPIGALLAQAAFQLTSLAMAVLLYGIYHSFDRARPAVGQGLQHGASESA